MKNIKTFEAFMFKTNKPTRRYRSFYSNSYDIKIKGFMCGSIEPEKPFKIRLMVWKTADDKAKPGNNPNCDWKWITLNRENESVEAAKEWLNKHFDEITKRWDIRKSENK